MARQTSPVLFKKKRKGMKNLFKEEVDFKEFKETMDQKSKVNPVLERNQTTKGVKSYSNALKK